MLVRADGARQPRNCRRPIQPCPGHQAGIDEDGVIETFHGVTVAARSYPDQRSARVGTGTRRELSYPPLKRWDSAWTPVLASVEAGDSYSPFTFTIPLFKRTPKGAPSPPPVWLRRRYRSPMFFAAL